ncbi:hypothetical protein EBT25_03795 [bacterium]|nr:hypothetical protein [bacterium]
MRHLFSFFQQTRFLLPLFLAAFFVPFLALPWFVDAYEVHKATFVILAAVFGGILFLANAMKTHSFTFVWSRWLFPLCVFFLATVLSALFSVSSAASWMGLGGGDYASVFFIASCVLTSFLFAQAGDHVHLFLKVLRVIWGAGAALITFALLAIFFGVIPLSPALSFGTPHALALFFGVVAFLWVGGTLEERASFFTRFVSACLFFVFFLIAFFLDAWVLWVPMFLSGILLLSFILARTQKGVRVVHLFPAILLIVLPITGLLLPQFLDGLFPAEVVPSFSLSVDIVRGVWSDDLRMFVGSGPGTYPISYALHALPSVNATIFWNVLFDRGFSYILTLAATGGLSLLLSFLFIQVSGIVVGFFAWSRSAQEHRGNILGLYLAFLFLSFSAWTYAWNTGIVFILFVLLGLLFGAGLREKYTWSLATSAQASVFASFGFVVSLVVLCLVLFISGTRYAAEVAYAQAVAIGKQSASPEEVLAKVDQAASFNRWNDMYYRELSLLLLGRVDDLVSRQAPAEQVQAVITAAVNAAIRATEISPNAVRNWEVRGNVYREVAPAVANAADFSIASFTTATQLAPHSPLYLVGLGRAYLMKADLLTQAAQTEDEALQTEALAAKETALREAEAVLLRAIELKQDYTAARYFLSAVYERQGKVADAVKSMEVVRLLDGEDVGVGMQLSLLYLRQGKNDLAKAELQRIIALSPTYANARWYLSVVLEQEGDIAGALAQVEEIARTNPEHEAVQQRLERLRSGEVEDDAALPDPLPEETVLDPDEGIVGDEGSEIVP